MRFEANMKKKKVLSTWWTGVSGIAVLTIGFSGQMNAEEIKLKRTPFAVRFEAKPPQLSRASTSDSQKLSTPKKTSSKGLKRDQKRDFRHQETKSGGQRTFYSNLFSQSFKAFQSKRELDQYLLTPKKKEVSHKPHPQPARNLVTLPPSPFQTGVQGVERNFSVD